MRCDDDDTDDYDWQTDGVGGRVGEFVIIE